MYSRGVADADVLRDVTALVDMVGAIARRFSRPSSAPTPHADSSTDQADQDCQALRAEDFDPGRVGDLLQSVNAAARDLAEHLVDTNRALLGRFEGVPAPIDVLEIVGRDRSEHVYCNLLAWLLRPDGSHGMGDSFLRRFLAVAGISHRGRVFSSSEPLAATVKREAVLPEVIISRPEEAVGGNRKVEGRHGPPRVDVVVALDSLLLVIEVKVEALPHDLTVRLQERRRLPQAAAYLAATYRLAHDPTMAQAYEKFKEHIGATTIPGLSHAASHLRVRGVLVHLPGLCSDADRLREEEFKTAHITWTSLEAILQACVDATQPRHEVNTLLSSFRTSLLRLVAQSGGENIPRLVERFRVLSSHPNLIAKSPLQAYQQVRALAETIARQEPCMLSQPRHRRFEHAW